MSEWTEAVEAKARIIHGQLAAACVIAERNGGSAHDIAQPYLELLRSLYRDEFAFAQLVDTSDLVARFVGPAVSGSDPTVTTVTGVFRTLQNQIRQIAKSIVGLSSDDRVAWPSDLDPHLSGMTHGSLVVGISIHSPDEDVEKGQSRNSRHFAGDLRVRPRRGEEHCNRRTSRSWRPGRRARHRIQLPGPGCPRHRHGRRKQAGADGTKGH